MNNYHLVQNKFFRKGDQILFDLFTITSLNGNKILLLPKGRVITVEDIEKIDKFKFIYIKDTDLPIYKDYIIDKESRSEGTSYLVELSKKVYGEASTAVNDILNNPEKIDNINKAEKVVEYLTDFVLNEELTIKSLLSIMEHDYYTHTHSINVSIYSLAFGQFLGLKDDQLKDLGISAILHDLGKSKIDFNIINKQGRLDAMEFTEMKKHPEIGYELAKKIGIENTNILSGIRHHHEKINGTGYPDKLSGDEISLFAKIIGVCDIFDALSTRRSYKDPLNTFEAFVLMKEKMKGELDPSIFNQFILMFKQKAY